MTNRLKTIEYACAPLSSQPNNTINSFAPLTIYIPESSLVFHSVVGKFTALPSANFRNLNTLMVEASLNSSAYTQNNGDPIHTDTWRAAARINIDLTDLFSANWSGTSGTLDVRFLLDSTGVSIDWDACCFTIYITYAYDDTSATHIKTIRYQLNADNTEPFGPLTTSKLASSPDAFNLSILCPEDTKVLRHAFIIVEGNTGGNGSVFSVVAKVQIDSNSAKEIEISQFGYSFNYRLVWRVEDDLDFNNVFHSFDLWLDSIYGTTGHCHPSIRLILTYEYNEANTTRILNSILIPFTINTEWGTQNYPSTKTIDYEVCEPGTIANRRSGYELYFQAYSYLESLYINTDGTNYFPKYFQHGNAGKHETDVIGRAGLSTSTTAGRNRAYIRHYRYSLNTDSWPTVCLSGYLLVNYESDKPAAGSGAANKTIKIGVGDNHTNLLQNIKTYEKPKNLGFSTETVYQIGSIGIDFEFGLFENSLQEAVTTTKAALACSRESLLYGQSYEILSNPPMYNYMYQGNNRYISEITDLFSRHPNDYQYGIGNPTSNLRYQRMSPSYSGGRIWTLYSNGKITYDADFLITYHSNQYTLSGSITNSNGGTVNLRLINKITGEVLARTTRVGNGPYNFSWYNNYDDLYVEAEEDNTYLGRSKTAKAV